GSASLYAIGGAIGGLVLALITIFKKEWSPVTAPMYALVEGLFLGAVSALFNMKYPGIVFQAVLLTFGTLAALLVALPEQDIHLPRAWREREVRQKAWFKAVPGYGQRPDFIARTGDIW
ncbi:Bax inhibitor-1/YccA family protein, partial [Mesorhizobium sp. M1D.F.Ca.ET.231.01.1.1]|uniref:Bax inhibitor-1/YccA family membrane protein n=1 Tax=Mesorhizobium sp. M1D.F.Ca.ET.231.01.1.1 TaxID=2496669 RepID=UPI001AEF1BB8